MFLQKIRNFFKPRPILSFSLSIFCKVFYDYQILTMLPEKYIYDLTYGVDFNPHKMVGAWAIFLIVSALSHYLLIKVDKTIATCIFLLMYLYYIPMNSAFYINNAPWSFLLLSSLFWIGLCAFSCISLFSVKKIEAPKVCIGKTFNKGLYSACLCLIVIGCIIYGYNYNGLDLTLDLTDIYDARAEFVGSTGTIESILFNFGGVLIIPIATLYALNNKKWILLVLSLIAQLAIFSIARQKSQLLIIVIVVCIFILSKMKLINKFKHMVPFAFSAFLSLSWLENLLFSSTNIFSMFIRRMMYYPAWLNTLYYDFFSENELLFWSQDVFLVNRLSNLGIIDRAYDESVIELINKTYYAGLVPSPNTGLFAEAYMHFGAIGAVLYPILIALMLLLLFKCVSFYDRETQLLMAVSVAMSLTSIPLTSGIFCITYFLFVPVTFILRYFTLRKQGLGNIERSSL